VHAGEKPGAAASSAVVEQIFTGKLSMAAAQVNTGSSSVDIGATLIPVAPNKPTNAAMPLEHTGKAPMDKTAPIEHLAATSAPLSCLALSTCPMQTSLRVVRGEVGGWGRDPKKCTGRDWGMGSSTI